MIYKGYIFTPEGEARPYQFDNYEVAKMALDTCVKDDKISGYIIPVPQKEEDKCPSSQ